MYLILESFQTKITDHIDQTKQGFFTVNKMMRSKNLNQEDQDFELEDTKKRQNQRKEELQNLFENEIKQCEDFII